MYPFGTCIEFGFLDWRLEILFEVDLEYSIYSNKKVGKAIQLLLQKMYVFENRNDIVHYTICIRICDSSFVSFYVRQLLFR